MSPNAKPIYDTEEAEKLHFQSTLISSILETENEIVVFAEGVGQTKKQRQKLQQDAAKKALDWLKKININEK